MDLTTQRKHFESGHQRLVVTIKQPLLCTNCDKFFCDGRNFNRHQCILPKNELVNPQDAILIFVDPKLFIPNSADEIDIIRVFERHNLTKWPI